MKATATIYLETSSKEQASLKDLFAPEDKELSNKRGSYSLTTKDSHTIITIQADDVIALRALTSAVTRVVSIFEKTKELVEREDHVK